MKINKAGIFLLRNALIFAFAIFAAPISCEAMIANQFLREGVHFMGRSMYSYAHKKLPKSYLLHGVRVFSNSEEYKGLANYQPKENRRVENEQTKEEQRRKKEDDDDIIDITNPLHPLHPLHLLNTSNHINSMGPYPSFVLSDGSLDVTVPLSDVQKDDLYKQEIAPLQSEFSQVSEMAESGNGKKIDCDVESGVGKGGVDGNDLDLDIDIDFDD